MESTLTSNPETDSLRQSDIVSNVILATPPTLLVLSCIDSCLSLGYISSVERGRLLHGQQLILDITLPL